MQSAPAPRLQPPVVAEVWPIKARSKIGLGRTATTLPNSNAGMQCNEPMWNFAGCAAHSGKELSSRLSFEDSHV